MPATATQTSLSLLERMRDPSDDLAWREFLRRYAPFINSVARRCGLPPAESADVAQESVLAVLAEFRQLSAPFDRSKGRFKAWLAGIVRHKVLDNGRRAAARQARDARHAAEESRESDDRDEAVFGDVFEQEWRRSLLARCLARAARETDPIVFQVFESCALHGHRPEVVARALGISRNAVYVNKSRVLKRLRRIVQELSEEEG